MAAGQGRELTKRTVSEDKCQFSSAGHCEGRPRGPNDFHCLFDQLLFNLSFD